MSREGDRQQCLEAVADAALRFHVTSVQESHSGEDCEVCIEHHRLRDALQDWQGTLDDGEDVPQPIYCGIPRREQRQRELLLRFGSLTLAMKRLESDARAYTHNQQMAEAARAWSKYHAVKAELHDLEPHLAGIRWEDFK